MILPFSSLLFYEILVFRSSLEKGDHFWWLKLTSEAAASASGVVGYLKPFYPLVFQSILTDLNLNSKMIKNNGKNFTWVIALNEGLCYSMTICSA